MNFKIQTDPVAILITGAAIDNVSVYGSLKMARAALDENVSSEIVRAIDECNKRVETLKLAMTERCRNLRTDRRLILKIREADLLTDADAPGKAEASGKAAE